MSELVKKRYLLRNSPYELELEECRYWLENPKLRLQRYMEIVNKPHLCPECRKAMLWYSDHVRFVWFECTIEDCSGERKIWL